MKNETSFPEEIIRLLETKNFNSLSESEQQMVLQSMTGEAYEELFSAAQTTKSFFKDEVVPYISASAKIKLDNAFQQQFPARKPILLQSVVLWKVAAVFLVLILGSVFYLRGNKMETSTTLLVHDTVFTEKNVETVKRIIDTVIEYKFAATPAGKVKQNASLMASKNHGRQDTNRIQNNIEYEGSIRTLQPRDLPKELPNHNGKSLQEDELVKRFAFARI